MSVSVRQTHRVARVFVYVAIARLGVLGTLLALNGCADCRSGREAGVELDAARLVAGARDAKGPGDDAADTRRRDTLAPRPVEFGEAGAHLGDAGGTLVAGDCRLVVSAGSRREPGVQQISCFSIDDVARSLPPGVILAAGDSNPANLGLKRIAKFYVPMQRAIPEEVGSLEVEMLSFHEQIGAWLTVGFATVSANDPTAMFLTDHIGPFVVRARPAWSEDRLNACDGATFNLGEGIPGSEDIAVGATPREARLTRAEAFSVLSDGRTFSVGEGVRFKNEEGDATRPGVSRDVLNHQDEDYLMDPMLAESLGFLAQLVRNEWRTAFTDEPAFELRITDAFDTQIEHRADSTHYQGRALDLTLEPLPRALLASRRAFYGRLARLAVCAGFDYALFENRFHVHVATRTSRIALLTDGPVGWALWAFSFSQPTVWTKLAEGIGKAPAGVSWPSEARVEVLADDGAVRGVVGDDGVYREVAAERPAAPPLQTLGNRTVRLVDGRAFLGSANGLISPGSAGADGLPLVFESPRDITPPGEGVRVLAFAFRDSDARRTAHRALQSE